MKTAAAVEPETPANRRPGTKRLLLHALLRRRTHERKEGGDGRETQDQQEEEYYEQDPDDEAGARDDHRHQPQVPIAPAIAYKAEQDAEQPQKNGDGGQEKDREEHREESGNAANKPGYGPEAARSSGR